MVFFLCSSLLKPIYNLHNFEITVCGLLVARKRRRAVWVEMLLRIHAVYGIARPHVAGSRLAQLFRAMLDYTGARLDARIRTNAMIVCNE